MALLAALIPAATSAAEGQKREYIVTLEVKDSGRNLKPTSRTNKVRIRQRSKAARLETAAVTKRQDVKARHRYGNVITGFSARMTKAEARKMARDPSVASVRVARTFKVASQSVPVGVRRVKAYPGGPSADIDANVAVIDTGIGPAEGNGEPIAMTTDELEIAGGYNCAGTVPTQQEGESASDFADRLAAYRGRYGDVNGHGTHVAGTIGARDNGYGAVGVAPGANLFAVRVFGSNGYTSEAAIVCGLDWVYDTHTPGLVPGVPPIDVVNMSIQGPRLDQLESCADIVGNPDADPMQAAICQLKSIDVPVVAAAGNSSANANSSAPGGFDQVITVAAMTDTDGVGWQDGSNAGCSGYSGEQDDTFASYSNYGTDVDIVAPGTCIWSTYYGDPSGDTLVRSTGTSMAAPHVTGAIARYVHASTGRAPTVNELRQLIRAAGRSDWDPKTDPVWYGVNDPDPPNRVLDVAALTGDPAVKTFLYHQSFIVAGSQASRSTRVDVQRSGGYAGQVELSTSGLPSGAGSTSFDDPSLNGLGKNNLGTNLEFDLDPSGGEGIYDVDVTSNGSGVSAHSRGIELTIDRTAPTVANLAPKVRGQKAGMSRKGATQVYLQWNANDALTGVKSAQLQRKIGTAAWKDAGVGGLSSSRVYLKPGQVNKFRVRVTDKAGNTQNSYSIGARLSVRDSKSSLFTKSGAWKTKKVTKAYGGSLLIAKAGTATLTATFTGKATAMVAPVGNGRGKFRVRVDGGAWQTVNTKTERAGQRKVVWTAKLANGKHRVEIQRVSGQPALDGLIVVR